ncbi:MAG: prepilin peptidase [Planctomycetota bacterium]
MTALPSTTWRMLAQRTGNKELPRGLDALWDTAVGMGSRLIPRQARFLREAQLVLDMDKQFAAKSDNVLRTQAEDFRALFRCGKPKRPQILEAFALVREVAFRQLGQKPFLVQVAGALAIESGCIAEMATGEGKTLTATMPAAIFGWRGRGCHVITVNDYLAKRDAQWMDKVYRFCGMRVSYIDQEMNPAGRRNAYLADITYCTNKEVAADFLRDRLSLGRVRGLNEALLAKIVEGSGAGTDRLVQRGLQYAVVDEADSVLIDEAVTPLIISGDAPNPEQVDAFRQAVDLGKQLTEKVHYRVSEKYREVELTNDGKEKLHELGGALGGLWAGTRRREELVIQALTAQEHYRLDKQYVIQEGKIVIVDEFTGRLMPDREWRDGLHQAVQAKESLEVLSPKETYARVSFQRFFRQYRQLSGMTGTAAEAVSEFWQIYHLPVVVIPTNRPCIRKMHPDRVFANARAKWQGILAEIRATHEAGRPVLVGTRSVQSSEALSGMLAAEGLEHQVLNAVRHAEEAQVVLGAGGPGRITVATNMAGRGTDIRLGSNVAEHGGLHVIASERHEAGRVDRQLFGRCARQGDPGSSVAFVCLDDELVRRHAQHSATALRARFGEAPGEISSTLTRHLFNSAQRRAQNQALRQRKGVLRTDDWLDEYLGFAGAER